MKLSDSAPQNVLTLGIQIRSICKPQFCYIRLFTVSTDVTPYNLAGTCFKQRVLPSVLNMKMAHPPERVFFK